MPGESSSLNRSGEVLHGFASSASSGEIMPSSTIRRSTYCCRFREALFGAVGAVTSRGGKNSRNSAGFRQRELVRGLAEINLGCRPDSPGSMSHMNGIQVHFENLLFGKKLFQAKGEDGLLGFSFKGLFLG